MMSEQSNIKDYIELVDKIAQFDVEAAEYLANEAPKLSLFDYCGDLEEVFLWNMTPQGNKYWYDIYCKLMVK